MNKLIKADDYKKLSPGVLKTFRKTASSEIGYEVEGCVYCNKQECKARRKQQNANNENYYAVNQNMHAKPDQTIPLLQRQFIPLEYKVTYPVTDQDPNDCGQSNMHSGYRSVY